MFVDELQERGVRLADTDKGKVSLLVNLSISDNTKNQKHKELSKMKYLAEKYGEKDFTVFGQFAFDVRESNQQRINNNLIAKSLNKLGFINE